MDYTLFCLGIKCNLIRYRLLLQQYRIPWNEAMSRVKQPDDNIYVKVVIIGDSNVGKTSIAQRFVDDTFHEHTSNSVGASYFVKHLEIEDRKVYFQIWDTAGQENFRSLVPMYLRNAKIALLVYDITSMISFLNLEVWRSDLLTAEPGVTVAVIGNKSDLKDNREVEVRKGQDFASKRGMLFTETSAKRGTNVEEIFFELGSQILLNGTQGLNMETVRVGPSEGIERKIRNCCS